MGNEEQATTSNRGEEGVKVSDDGGLEIIALEEDDSAVSQHEEEEEPVAAVELPEVNFPNIHSTTTNHHSLLQFRSDFTLGRRGDSVRFRSGAVTQVHELDGGNQLHLVVDDNDQSGAAATTAINVKNVHNDRSFALAALRGSYTLFCLFFAGILFILCFQVLLFLFMDLVRYAGLVQNSSLEEESGGERDGAKLVGTLLACPLLVYGFAAAMSLAGAWTADTWQGHAWFKTVGHWASVVTEWLVLVLLLGVPMVTATVLLFMGDNDDWWKITALTWFSCVCLYFVVFACFMIYYELRAAWTVLRELETASGDSNNLLSLLGKAVLHRQIYQFSGYQTLVRVTTTMTGGNDDDDQNATPQLEERGKPSPWSWLTRTKCCAGRLFETVDPPERLYSTEDILGSKQFTTAHSWSLDKIFCANDRIKSISVVRGPVAIRRNQMRSSLVCAVGGTILVLLLLSALLVYLDGEGFFAILLIIAVVMCCIPRIRNTVRVFKVYMKTGQEEELQGDDARLTERGTAVVDGISHSHEKYRVSRPTRGFCWFMFGLEVGLLFVWPMVTLFAIKNTPIAVLFLIVGGVSMLRYYLNAAILIKALGTFGAVGAGQDTDKQWKTRSRLCAILLRVTRGPIRRVWIWIFILMTFGLAVFAVASLGTSTEDAASSSQDVVILPQGDFVYEPQPNLPYPTCRLVKGLEIPNSNSTALADYAFLAAMAYQRPEAFQDRLDAWFGPGVATNRPEIVEQFRGKVEGGQAAVDYRFVTFGDDTVGVVIVRGSTTAWEWLTDAQLWSGAALAGLYRFVLPIGQIFTPILAEVLKAISWVESDSLKEVALYQQTTSFVEALQSTGNYTILHITGQVRVFGCAARNLVLPPRIVLTLYNIFCLFRASSSHWVAGFP